MYTIQVYMARQADNWHNVGTARYHRLGHRTSYDGVGVHHVEPTGSAS